MNEVWPQPFSPLKGKMSAKPAEERIPEERNADMHPSDLQAISLTNAYATAQPPREEIRGFGERAS